MAENSNLNTAGAGRVLDGRYQLGELLGAGGMGTVHRATHLTLGRTVAVKLLHPTIGLEERAVMRFRQEMQAMSELNHPHLISIIDAGVTEDGIPYFVMEYLEGLSLDQVLDSGALGVKRAINVGLQIADALAYAHGKGIIHRDLKPGNIMLLGSKDFVKVVDLGIAKLKDQENSAQKLTQTGEVFGSPLYMSPEQCLGKKLDGRADVYSIGCLLFESLTRRLPIQGASPLETLMKHLNEPPIRLREMDGIALAPDVVAMDELIARCLEKDPNDRPQSMEDLSGQLERILSIDSSGAAAQAGIAHGVLRSKREGAPKQAKELYTEETKPLSAPNPVRVPEPSRASEDRASASNQIKPWMLVVATLSIIGAIAMTMFKTPVQVAYQSSPQTMTNDPAQLQREAFSRLPFSEGVEMSNDDYPARVYLVSNYLGVRPDEFYNKFEEWGKSIVVVKDETKPVILVLTSYCPVEWTVKRENSRVRIKKIIASSYMGIKVIAPEGVPVERAWYPHFDENARSTKKLRKNPFEFFTVGRFADLKGDPSWKDIEASIKALTGQPVYKFWGRYESYYFIVN